MRRPLPMHQLLERIDALIVAPIAALVAALIVVLFTAGAALADEVVIGYTGPLSGGAALYGKNTLAGLTMAAAEINAGGGISVAGKTYQLKLVSLDDQYSPSVSGVNGKRLVAQYGAKIVFAAHSAGAYALQAFNEQDNFIVAAYSSVPNITERGNPLTLRIPPPFPAYIPTFIKVEMARFGRKLAIATGDHDYARLWADTFATAWKQAGGSVISTDLMSYNKDADFYSGVSRALSGHPDVLLVGGASEPTALVIRQARELGFQGGFAVLDQAKMDEMASVLGGLESLEGAVGVMPLAYDQTPAVSAFSARYRQRGGKDPGSEVAFNYTALYAFAEAMKLAGSVSDPKAIFARLNEAFAHLPADHNPSHVSGVDARGAANSAVAVAQVENGRIANVNVVPTTP
jgi:branched-chain amino acid transport system substrate-binding protein